MATPRPRQGCRTSSCDFRACGPRLFTGALFRELWLGDGSGGAGPGHHPGVTAAALRASPDVASYRLCPQVLVQGPVGETALHSVCPETPRCCDVPVGMTVCRSSRDD